MVQIATPIQSLNDMNMPGGGDGKADTPIQADPQQQAINLPDGLKAGYVVEWCQTRNKAFDTWFEPYKRGIDDMNRMYRTKNNARIKSTYPNALPISNAIIETAVARTVPALLNRPKLIEVDSDVPGSNPDISEAIEDFINEQLHHSLSKPRIGADAIKGTFIEGTGIGKVVWKIDTDVQEQPTIDPVTGIQIGSQEIQLERQYACFEPLSILNMAWEPKHSSPIQNSPWIRQRSWMSLTDLFKMQKAGQISGVEKLAQIVPAGVANRDDWEKARKDGLAYGWSAYAYGAYNDSKEYKIDEWWACLSWKDSAGQDQYGEFHWFMVEDQHIVMFDKNPYRGEWKPYISYRCKINPREMMGESMLSPVKDLQEMINAFAGKVGDLVDKAADTPTYYGRGSGITGRNFIVRTKGLIPVDDVNQIKEGNVNTAAISATENYTQTLVQFMRESTPANDMAQGLSKGADTATEAAILSKSAGARFAHSIELLGVEFVCEMAERFLWLYQQFGQDGQMFYRSDIDGETRELKRSDIQGRYILKASTAATEQDKTTRINQLTQFMQMMGSIPPLQQSFDFVEFVQKELMPMFGVFNGKAYVKEAPMMPMGIPGGMPGAMPEGGQSLPAQVGSEPVAPGMI